MKAINIALLVSLTATSLALADELGGGGRLTELEINTTSAETYLQYHGRAVITATSGKTSTHTEYRWGGVSCGSRTLNDAQVALLQRALETAAPIVPRYQDGQGSAKCLVGFRIAP